MSKPDWKDAPERAMWLAQDLSGAWYWFELTPFQHPTNVWVGYGRSWPALFGNGDENPSWTETLERRP